MSEIIHGLSNEAYHNSPEYAEYISSSQLKLYLKSPAAYKYAVEHPQPQTDAMRFGSLFHDVMAAIAEGASLCEVLDAIAVFKPPINERSGKPFGPQTDRYKDAYKTFIESDHGSLFGSAGIGLFCTLGRCVSRWEANGEIPEFTDYKEI